MTKETKLVARPEKEREKRFVYYNGWLRDLFDPYVGCPKCGGNERESFVKARICRKRK